METDEPSRSTPFAWGWPAGRALLALLFGVSGALKLAFHAPIAGMIAAKGFPAPSLLAWLAALFEIGGAICLVAGVRLFEVAIAFGLWSLLTAIVVHQFWAATGQAQQLQLADFLKNVALFGAFLVVAYEARRRSAARAIVA